MLVLKTILIHFKRKEKRKAQWHNLQPFCDMIDNKWKWILTLLNVLKVLISVLSNLVAIRHMWRQEIWMWRDSCSKMYFLWWINYNISQILTKVATEKPLCRMWRQREFGWTPLTYTNSLLTWNNTRAKLFTFVWYGFTKNESLIYVMKSTYKSQVLIISSAKYLTHSIIFIFKKEAWGTTCFVYLEQ